MTNEELLKMQSIVQKGIEVQKSIDNLKMFMEKASHHLIGFNIKCYPTFYITGDERRAWIREVPIDNDLIKEALDIALTAQLKRYQDVLDIL